MLLRHLALSNFRNYSQLDLEPVSGLNVYVGANAQGKSNLLEGIAMLGTGKSFRTSRDGDTVRAGVDLAVVRGDATLRSGRVELACVIEKGARGTRKSYSVNGGGVRYAAYLGQIRVVTFVPADLALAAGPPGARRAFLNVALAQSEPRYYHELARYRRALHPPRPAGSPRCAWPAPPGRRHRRGSAGGPPGSGRSGRAGARGVRERMAAK